MHNTNNLHIEIQEELLFPPDVGSVRSKPQDDYQKKKISTVVAEELTNSSLPNYSTWATKRLNNGVKARVNRIFTSIHDFVLRVKKPPQSKGGRTIPIEVLSDRPLLVDARTSKPYCNNLITSSIYTVYNFFPRQLVAQFSKLANLYFLCVSIMQMIPSWSTTGTYTTIAPLLFFISISMGREGYDDWRRHRQDKEENNRIVHVAQVNPLYYRLPTSVGPTSNASVYSSTPHSDSTNSPIAYKRVAWKNLRVGEIVKLKQNEGIPADIIILSSSGVGGISYIETMALDGETNLKTREPLPDFAKWCSHPEKLVEFTASVTAEDPNIDLYNFEGRADIEGNTYPLSSSHIIYRGSVLRNTAWIIGLVVFSGEETKIRMNAIQNPRTKAPRLQKKVTTLSYLWSFLSWPFLLSVLLLPLYFIRFRVRVCGFSKALKLE